LIIGLFFNGRSLANDITAKLIIMTFSLVISISFSLGFMQLISEAIYEKTLVTEKLTFISI
jgi:hypothetical protein